MISKIINNIKNLFVKDSLTKLIKSGFVIILRKTFHPLLKVTQKYFGFRLIRTIPYLKIRQTRTNINVGCGNYEIEGFISVDYFSNHYYGSKKFDRVKYDMRNDDLPFENDFLDTIYCSYVIEHIETQFVIKFFKECLRCLKPGGVLRIVCPDSEYMYYQLLNHPEYFSWHPLYHSKSDAALCFVEEIATPKAYLEGFGLSKSIFEYEYFDLLIELRSGLTFNNELLGQHINNWDFQRICELSKKLGYSLIEKSRHQGSFCAALRGPDIDLNNPAMSLYVDMQK